MTEVPVSNHVFDNVLYLKIFIAYIMIVLFPIHIAFLTFCNDRSFEASFNFNQDALRFMCKH